MKETIAAILLKTTKRRFLSLCASALLGLALFWFLNDLVDKCPDNNDLVDKCPDDNFLKILLDKLSILIVSLPTAIFLWWFRTHDVGQGLKQSKDTYNQSDFFDGLDRLVSDEPLNIDLGVKKLIDFAEKDNSYNKDIRFAFIKRLKHLPKKYEEEAQKVLERNEKGNIPYLTYAQHILLWFKDKGIKIEDISNTRFDFQEFVLDVSGLDVYKQAESPLVYFLKQNNSSKNITFIHANLREVNLAGVQLEGADLLGADLLGAKLPWANLRKANLPLANLYGADLRWAKLAGANLRKANLAGANLLGGSLPGADLPGANLYGADLRVAQLVGADLHGADLRVAQLVGADLHGADLHGAKLEGANFLGADLEGGKLPEGIMKYPREQ